MSELAIVCRLMARDYLEEAARSEQKRSANLADYYRSKASMWLRRAARAQA